MLSRRSSETVKYQGYLANQHDLIDCQLRHDLFGQTDGDSLNLVKAQIPLPQIAVRP